MGRKSTILVDDEEDILPEYQEMLELAGFDSITTSNPEEAFRIVCRNPEIQLVVTDLRMARLDGASLIRQLKETLPERKLRFIVITGDATIAHDPALVGGPVLLKPVDRNLLIQSVSEALSGSL